MLRWRDMRAARRATEGRIRRVPNATLGTTLPVLVAPADCTFRVGECDFLYTDLKLHPFLRMLLPKGETPYFYTPLVFLRRIWDRRIIRGRL